LHLKLFAALWTVTNDVKHRMLYSCTRMATVGVEGLMTCCV